MRDPESEVIVHGGRCPRRVVHGLACPGRLLAVSTLAPDVEPPSHYRCNGPDAHEVELDALVPAKG